MQLAALEDGQAIAEDEVGIALDIAVGEVLARGFARTVIAIAISAGGEERVLRANYPQIAKNGAIRGDGERDRLAFADAKIVDDAQVIDDDVRRLYEDRAAGERAAIGRAVVENDNGLRRIGIFAVQPDVWLADTDDFAVCAGLDGDLSAGDRQGVDCLLDGFAGSDNEIAPIAGGGYGGEIEGELCLQRSRGESALAGAVEMPSVVTLRTSPAAPVPLTIPRPPKKWTSRIATFVVGPRMLDRSAMDSPDTRIHAPVTLAPTALLQQQPCVVRHAGENRS